MDYFFTENLLELTSAGFTREQAYSIVQKHAMQSWNNKPRFMKI